MLHTITVQKNNSDVPPEDAGHAEVEGHSDFLPLVASIESHRLFFLCNKIIDTIEF